MNLVLMIKLHYNIKLRLPTATYNDLATTHSNFNVISYTYDNTDSTAILLL